MKMGFAFMILLCSIQNTHGMDEVLPALMTKNQSSQAQESSTSSVDKNSLLIKACKRTDTTTKLVSYILCHGADVNAVVDNTTALLTAIEMQDDNDPSIILMLVPHATAKHKVLALKHAINKEKWNTMKLLQNEYDVVLSNDDIQEHHTFVFAPAIAWAKGKASAARARLSRVIKNFKNPAYDGDDNNCDDKDNDCDDKDSAEITHAIYQTSTSPDESSINIATLGGMPH